MSNKRPRRLVGLHYWQYSLPASERSAVESRDITKELERIRVQQEFVCFLARVHSVGARISHFLQIHLSRGLLESSAAILSLPASKKQKVRMCEVNKYSRQKDKIPDMAQRKLKFMRTRQEERKIMQE
jgi:hypothetical protein